jgi:hypothetical protein
MHRKDKVDFEILPIVKHEDDHCELHINMYLHPKDKVDLVILTIVEHLDDH